MPFTTVSTVVVTGVVAVGVVAVVITVVDMGVVVVAVVFVAVITLEDEVVIVDWVQLASALINRTVVKSTDRYLTIRFFISVS